MAKPFRKLEIALNGSVYVLNRAASEMLLGRLDAFGEVVGDACRTLREDLRAALAAETEGPVPANPFDADGVPVVEQTVAVRIVEEAVIRGEGVAERCFLCDQPGRELEGQSLWVCDTPGCPRCGKPAARGFFETGIR
jgi:hypothetical protein